MEITNNNQATSDSIPISSVDTGYQLNEIQYKPIRLFKVIVIGDSNVGKTCLTFRFCGGKFLDKSEATIGVDFREKQLDIEDERIKLQIWDTGKKKEQHLN